MNAAVDAPTIRSHPRFPLQPHEARRLLRFELERLVAEAGVRHGTLAGWLGVSRPAVTQAMTGASLFRRPHLEVLCAYTNRLEWLPRLDGLRRLVHRKGKGEQGTPSGPRDAELVVGLEAFADEVVVFEPWLVPPHLQTPMYAAALAKPDSANQNAARERRQVPLLNEVDPLGFTWLTTEHALHRRVGDAALMRDQHAHLVELATRPNICIRVIPSRADLAASGSSFQLIRRTPTVVVEETRLAVHHASEPGVAAYFARLLGDLQRHALDPEASVALAAGLLS